MGAVNISRVFHAVEWKVEERYGGGEGVGGGEEGGEGDRVKDREWEGLFIAVSCAGSG